MAGPTPVQPHRPQVPTTYILLIPWRCDALPLCPTARGGLCTGCSLCLDRSFLSPYTDLCSNTTSSGQFSVYLGDDLLVAISILYSKHHQAGTMSVSFFLVSAASSPMPGCSRCATNTWQMKDRSNYSIFKTPAYLHAPSSAPRKELIMKIRMIYLNGNERQPWGTISLRLKYKILRKKITTGPKPYL